MKLSGRFSFVFAVLVAAGGCADDNGAAPGTVDRELREVIAERGITVPDPGPSHDPTRVELGRFLMFDKILSGNKDISCATCHHSLLRTGDGLPVSIGTGGRGLGPLRVRGEDRPFIPRNAPELFVRGSPEWRTMFWDMRVAGDPETGFSTPAGEHLPPGLESLLAAQAMFPVTSRDEMRGRPGDLAVDGEPNELATISDDDLPAIWDALMARLLSVEEYRELFAAAYPDLPTEQLGFQHAANAIAAFEATAWALLDSPWDRYLQGDDDALPESAKRGALLFFGKARCSNCHAGSLFTDQQAHNLAVPQVGPGKGAEAPLDFGRGRETGRLEDRYAFRTPPLRNVAVTGPWMHDGAFSTLESAVRHHLDPRASLLGYDPASHLPPELVDTFQDDPDLLEEMLSLLDEELREPPVLDESEIADLLTFLEALTDPAALDLSEDIPERVPSGLPVAD
ncbi:MAG: methylamine utilization protein MauG [Candidatus Binatia bacterium]|nr:MAG: methylamine utilization protein MauG [Candidatus Binatia bacterium]